MASQVSSSPVRYVWKEVLALVTYTRATPLCSSSLRLEMGGAFAHRAVEGERCTGDSRLCSSQGQMLNWVMAASVYVLV